MTDLEMLISLCQKLGLRRAADGEDRPGYDEYGVFAIAGGKEVRLGAGEGYYGFYAAFTFDGAGALIEHGVWE
jgi:hypothetical protein